MTFQDNNNDGKLTVMRYIDNTRETVGDGLSVGEVNSIALAFDENDYPYVAYVDGGDGSKLNVIRYVTDTREDVGTNPVSTSTVSAIDLTFDSSKTTPFVAYQDGGETNPLTVAAFTNDSWATIAEGAPTAGPVMSVSLALDSNDVPYVAYKSDASKRTSLSTVMKLDSTRVSVGSIKTIYSPFAYGEVLNPSLAFDKDNVPYIAYTNGKDKDKPFKAMVIKYDSNNDLWTPVDSAGISAGNAGNVVLAFDHTKTFPIIAYSD